MLSNCTQYSSMLSPALTLAHTGNIAQATSSLAINKAKDDYVESLNLNALDSELIKESMNDAEPPKPEPPVANPKVFSSI